MTVLQLAQKVKAQIVPEFGGLGEFKPVITFRLRTKYLNPNLC